MTDATQPAGNQPAATPRVCGRCQARRRRIVCTECRSLLCAHRNAGTPGAPICQECKDESSKAGNAAFPDGSLQPHARRRE